MSLHAVDFHLAPRLPARLSRQEWELLFASVRARLEQIVAGSAQGAEPFAAMTRIRGDVLECSDALRKLQILRAPARADFRDTD